MKPKTIDIKGKKYVQVNERVKEFHDDKRNFTEKTGRSIQIATEVLQHEPCVVIRATVVTGFGTFTGISFANVNKAIEKTSPYEVAETSAVGRALGFAGYGIVDSIASADEIAKANMPISKRDDAPFGENSLVNNED